MKADLTRHRWLIICVLACLATFVSASGTCRAGSGSNFFVPSGTKPKNALQMRVDTRWVDGNGYRPVRVEMINWPPSPTKADRLFRIVVQPRCWDGNNQPRSVTQYIEMPQGTPRAKAIVSVPQTLGWTNLRVDVYEDGYHLEDVSFNSGINITNYSWSEYSPSVLFIDSDAPPLIQRNAAGTTINFSRGGQGKRELPNLQMLAGYYPNSPWAGNYRMENPNAISDSQILQYVQNLPKVEIAPLPDLPTRFIDYTSLDIIFIDLADLRKLVSTRPESWEAIRKWMSTGATLCVFDTEPTNEVRSYLNKIAELNDGGPDDDSKSMGWLAPLSRNDARREIPSLMRGNSTSSKSSSVHYSQRNTAPTDSDDPFMWRNAGLGHLFAIHSSQPFGDNVAEAGWVMNQIGQHQWSWYQRHGFSYHRENREFHNWSIPGIGRAPVVSYLILISLFVICIGPINYYFLRRRKRLYLLLVTVPLGAGAVTFVLLNYALLSDGLGVRSRIRSFTQIDQRNGEAVAWSRQTYYAGLAPSRGLTFPEDAAVYPVSQYSEHDYRSKPSGRVLLWDEGQHLISGYIRSRSTSQFVVVQTQETERHLKVRDARDGFLTGSNQLGATLMHLLVRGADGKFYAGKDIAPAADLRLPAVTSAEAAAVFRKVYNDNRPAFPPGYNSQYYRYGWNYRNSYSRWTNNENNLPTPSFQLGVLERQLYDSTSLGIDKMSPSSYVAIALQSPEVAVGYDAKEEASFHVIAGKW